MYVCCDDCVVVIDGFVVVGFVIGVGGGCDWY